MIQHSGAYLRQRGRLVDAVRHATVGGASANEIGQQLGISYRTVQRIRAELRAQGVDLATPGRAAA